MVLSLRLVVKVSRMEAWKRSLSISVMRCRDSMVE